MLLLLEEMKMSSSATANIRYTKVLSKNKWKKKGLEIIVVHKDKRSFLAHVYCVGSMSELPDSKCEVISV